MSFSTMYVGATGVVAHGDRMQVVANNLANVSTVGYKKADAQFADLMSQQMASGGAQYQSGARNVSQIGKGVSVGEIRSIFKEGGLENSNTVTDLAITGNGFFGVRNVVGADVTTGASHYTRAGNFRFDNLAYLVDPSGFRLQGYAIDRETGEVSSTVSDVQLPYDDIIVDGQPTRLVRSDPRATTSFELVTNLDALTADLYTNDDNPFFAMFDSYNGNLSNSSTPFGSTPPAYSTSISVYDENGNDQDLIVYFDPVDNSTISNASAGHTYWEYIIAMPGSADGSANYGTSAAGLAGLGVMTFNGSGELVNHTAFSLSATASNAKSLSSWEPASFSDDGTPELNFTFGSNGSAIGSTSTISFDFGIDSTSGSWNSSAGTAANVGTSASNLASMQDIHRDVRSSTSFDSGSVTLFSDQDGFTWGYLQNTSVTREGILSGLFSNGQTEEFYQIAMYRFNSEWGLRRDGANRFVSTEASGNPIAGTSEQNGRGVIQQNTLEMSNVDMAEEFANMIVTQRGYQANTKVITTADALLNTTINVKR